MGFSCLQVVQMELVGLVTFRLSHGAHPSCFWVLCSSFINSESMHRPRLQTCPERWLGKLEDLGVFGGCWVRFLISIPFLTHPGSPLVQSWVGNWCQEIFLSKCPVFYQNAQMVRIKNCSELSSRSCPLGKVGGCLPAEPAASLLCVEGGCFGDGWLWGRALWADTQVKPVCEFVVVPWDPLPTELHGKSAFP